MKKKDNITYICELLREKIMKVGRAYLYSSIYEDH